MPEASSYKRSLKSTSLMGGASLINMAINMIRTKFVAILLGPSGVGLIGVYSSLTSMVGIVTGMGVLMSGIRQISEAHGTGEPERMARTAKTLRRTVWVTGSLGMLVMVLGSIILSKISFGNKEHAVAIAVLGVSILLTAIAGGQNCILMGTRRIGDVAKIGIIGAFTGTVISIPCFYFWGVRGIVPSLVLSSGATVLSTWWFARRVLLVPVEMPWRESRKLALDLLHFGIPFMLSGLMGVLGAYVIRLLLVRQVGIEGVGIWQAAFSISGLLVGFVLTAMGTDYYPRLSEVSHDHQAMNQAVNEQTEIALMLAVPGLAATLIFAPLAILVFYSGKFEGAVDILRWSVFGIFGRVISWPMGFVPLAKGMGNTFLGMEAFSNFFYVAAMWLCVRKWGLPGTGIAFILFYLANTVVTCTVSRTIARISWNRTNKRLILACGGVLVTVGLVSAFVQNPWMQFPLNVTLLALVSAYCLHRLSSKSGINLRWLQQRLVRS